MAGLFCAEIGDAHCETHRTCLSHLGLLQQLFPQLNKQLLQRLIQQQLQQRCLLISLGSGLLVTTLLSQAGQRPEGVAAKATVLQAQHAQ